MNFLPTFFKTVILSVDIFNGRVIGFRCHRNMLSRVGASVTLCSVMPWWHSAAADRRRAVKSWGKQSVPRTNGKRKRLKGKSPCCTPGWGKEGRGGDAALSVLERAVWSPSVMPANQWDQRSWKKGTWSGFLQLPLSIDFAASSHGLTSECF